jgi:hypothetical protein
MVEISLQTTISNNNDNKRKNSTMKIVTSVALLCALAPANHAFSFMSSTRHGSVSSIFGANVQRRAFVLKASNSSESSREELKDYRSNLDPSRLTNSSQSSREELKYYRSNLDPSRFARDDFEVSLVTMMLPYFRQTLSLTKRFIAIVVFSLSYCFSESLPPFPRPYVIVFFRRRKL